VQLYRRNFIGVKDGMDLKSRSRGEVCSAEVVNNDGGRQAVNAGLWVPLLSRQLARVEQMSGIDERVEVHRE
jgi:hypothetical protein